MNKKPAAALAGEELAQIFDPIDSINQDQA